MFDGISLNHRRLGTRQNLRVRTAPSTEDTRQQMKIGRTPFITENNLLLENEPACGNRVEHSAQFFVTVQKGGVRDLLRAHFLAFELDVVVNTIAIACFTASTWVF